VRTVSDPRLFADPNGPDIFQIRGHLRNPQIRFPRVAVRIGDPAIEGQPHVVFNDDFAGNNK
jgi:hypothetical protein